MVFNYFQTAPNSLVIGKVIKLMVLVDLNILMVLIMKVTLKTIKFKKVYFIILVVHTLKVILTVIEIFLNKVKYTLMMGKYSKVNGIVMEF